VQKVVKDKDYLILAQSCPHDVVESRVLGNLHTWSIVALPSWGIFLLMRWKNCHEFYHVSSGYIKTWML